MTCLSEEAVFGRASFEFVLQLKHDKLLAACVNVLHVCFNLGVCLSQCVVVYRCVGFCIHTRGLQRARS